MRRTIVIALVALVAAGVGGRAATSAIKNATVKQVQQAFEVKGIPFSRAMYSDPRISPRPRLWPVHQDVDAHVLALLTAFAGPKADAFNVWVFDSAANAKAALKRTPELDRGGKLLLLSQANVVVAVAQRKREKLVRAALTLLRNPGKLPKLGAPPADD